MWLKRRRSWIKSISVCGVGLLLSGMTKEESVQLPELAVEVAQGAHVDARFDATFHGVVEEISFSDVASY